MTISDNKAETENTTEEFKGLPMRDLIGAPLQAACESQQKLAESALEFMTRIGFEEKAYSLGNEEKNLFFCIRTKSKCMNVTVFNPAQLQVLDMMSFVDSPEALAELKKAISDYFAKQAQREIDRLWESGELNEEKIENFYQLHERTPYK